MNWKSFTPEELMEIRNNPYVKSATNNMIRFTAAFMLEFWEQYHEQGRPPLEIMRSMGFDPQVLGESRIRGIILHIREQVQGGNGFTDVRQSLSSSGPAAKTLPPSKAVIHMQHEIAYLKQELEYIKKILLADREARRKCSFEPNQTSNSQSSEK